jgi:hypothetical protein
VASIRNNRAGFICQLFRHDGQKRPERNARRLGKESQGKKLISDFPIFGGGKPEIVGIKRVIYNQYLVAKWRFMTSEWMKKQPV